MFPHNLYTLFPSNMKKISSKLKTLIDSNRLIMNIKIEKDVTFCDLVFDQIDIDWCSIKICNDCDINYDINYNVSVGDDFINGFFINKLEFKYKEIMRGVQ